MKRKSIMLLMIATFSLLSACGSDVDESVSQANDFLSVYSQKSQAEKQQTELGDSTSNESVQMKDAQTSFDTESLTTENSENTDNPAKEGQFDSENPSMTDEIDREDILLDTLTNEVNITISAAGDVTLGNYWGQDYEISFREMWDNKQDASYFFENVYDILSADDMTLVNLEGPLTYAEERKEYKTYCISGDPEYASILTAGSVEAVSMANNHRLDYYDQGSEDTVKAIEQEGIVYGYDSILGIYEVKGIRIGYVAVDEISQETGIERIMEKGIQSLKDKEVDLILACCHWGIERDYYPDEYQQSFGKKCIDLGADLVIGHHPHVIQGIEEYQGKYIIYSLGNFCFGANRNPPDKDTLIFQQTFHFDDGVRQSDSEARIIPCSVSSVSGRNDYKPTPLYGEDATRVLGRMNTYSQPFGVQFDENGYIIR